MPGLFKAESLGEGGLIDGRAVGRSRHHATLFEMFFGSADRFGIHRRLGIARYTAVTAQRTYGCKEPTFVFDPCEDDADWNGPGDPLGTSEQRRCNLSRTVVVSVPEDQYSAFAVALAQFAPSESYGVFKIRLCTHSSLRQPVWRENVEFVRFNNFVSEATKKYRNSRYFAMPFDNRVNG